jgi:hypothetical protein
MELNRLLPLLQRKLISLLKALVIQAMSPKRVGTPGRIPEIRVATEEIAMARQSEPGVPTGVVSPSGSGFIPTSRMIVP